MCGRFALTLPLDAVAGWFDAVQAKAGPERPRYNICPSQKIPVVALHAGRRQLVPMRWGFIPRWYKSPTDGPMLNNARGETIAEKPAFCGAFQTRRCVIPASGYFEWQKQGAAKQPFYIASNQAPLLGFAGIWQAWQGANGQREISCAIITTAASPEMETLHHREPVVVDPVNTGLWLQGDPQQAAGLIRPAPAGFYQPHAVSLAVNSARTQGPDLIGPVYGAMP